MQKPSYFISYWQNTILCLLLGSNPLTTNNMWCTWGLDFETRPASWSSGNAFVSGVWGLRFKSRAGQIGHSVANSSPPLRHFLEWSCVAHRRNDAEMSPANSLHTLAYYSEYNERFNFDLHTAISCTPHLFADHTICLSFFSNKLLSLETYMNRS